LRIFCDDENDRTVDEKNALSYYTTTLTAALDAPK